MKDISIFLILTALSIFLWIALGYSPMWILLLVLAVLVGLLPFGGNFIAPQIIFLYKKHLTSDCRLIISNEFIELKTPKLNYRHNWSSIYEVNETHRFFLLYYDTNSFTIVPKRIFDDLNQLAAFRETLQSNIRDFR